MTNKGITDLTNAGTLDGTESVHIVQGGNSRQTTLQEIADIHVYSVNTQTGATYTLALSDLNNIVVMNNASANTITIPANASVAFPIGTVVTIIQDGAGLTTVSADTGVTLNNVSAGSAALFGQNSLVSIIKISADKWNMVGKHTDVG